MLFVTRTGFLLVFITGLTSCGSYRKNIMFIPGRDVPEMVRLAAQKADRDYVIQKNDLLKLQVFTHQGERIIDPDFQLTRDLNPQGAQLRPDPEYMVDTKGVVKLPMIGEIRVEGLTLRQAEEMLQKAYGSYYTNPLVYLQCTSKRIVVLGLPQSKVIPIAYDQISLTEVLALAGGLDRDSRADNIRVIRGNEFYLADLSSIKGYAQNNMLLQPGDIVYVEPIRRPVSEALRDYLSVVSILSSLTTLIVVLNNR